MNANLLRAKMAENGVTQANVADAIGISQNSLSRKILGKREFKLSEVAGMCIYLKISNPQEIFLP